MKIVMLDTRIVGVRERRLGDVWDAPEDLGKQLIYQGTAAVVVPKRAREDDGTYSADDPATAVNEAWADGKLPRRARKEGKIS